MSDYERGYNHGCRDTLSKVVVTKDRERAVIKAAQAWHAADTGRERYHAEKELQLTVEALQEAV